MELKVEFVISVLMLVMFHWCLGDAVQQCTVPECQCRQQNPGIFLANCSCLPGQGLTISSLTDSLPSPTTKILISDCQETVVVQENAFKDLSFLETITFQSLTNLIFQSNSINLSLYSEFNLTFISVSALTFEENAVTLRGTSAQSSNNRLIIRDSTITKLESNAINASLSELRMEHVSLAQKPPPKAINLEMKVGGVYIDRLTSKAGGLGTDWLTGKAKIFSLVNSNITLVNRAFTGIHMLHSSPSVTLLGNNFRYLNSSNVIGMNTVDNQLTCECGGLVWLLETLNSREKQMKTMKCISGNNTTTVQCSPSHACSHQSSSSILLLLVSGVILLLTVSTTA